MATNSDILTKAKASLARILDSDSSQWSESQRAQNLLEIDKLSALIDRFEAKTEAEAGRRLFRPIKRVGV